MRWCTVTVVFAIPTYVVVCLPSWPPVSELTKSAPVQNTAQPATVVARSVVADTGGSGDSLNDVTVATSIKDDANKSRETPQPTFSEHDLNDTVIAPAITSARVAYKNTLLQRN
jgi:hypothetical protein